MVYLHVPFCRSFCTYCDFYSEIACKGRDAQSFEQYAEALCAEASLRRDEIEATRDLNTLYIGGGTNPLRRFAPGPSSNMAAFRNRFPRSPSR